MLVAIAAPLLAGPFPASSKLEREYQSQQGKLKRYGDAVKKVKILIKMSKIDLKLAGRRATKRFYSEADGFLMRYIETVLQAEQFLKESKRNPQRKPAGFKHLEISLRKQLRQLSDIRDRYPYDQQEKIDQAIGCAEAVKERMIAALFGVDNTAQPVGQADEVGPTRATSDPSRCENE